MDKQMLDIYTNHLISSFSYTTATGLSHAFSGMISHDKITRFLAAEDYDSKRLWKLVKKTIRQIESEEGVLIVDDTIEEKPYTDKIKHKFEQITNGNNQNPTESFLCLNFMHIANWRC